MKNVYVVAVVFVLLNLVEASTGSICVTGPIVIEISSLLPNPPLSLHCQSGDDDLGNHTLATTQTFQWHFCINAFDNTLFFCSFKWGSKRASFEIINDLKPDRVLKNKSRFECLWDVIPDGFYFHQDDEMIVKKYGWNETTP